MVVDNKKIMPFVRIGLVAGIGFIIYKVVRRQIIKKKVLSDFGDISTVTNSKRGNKGGFTLPTNVKSAKFNPRRPAQKLYNAMKGVGTDVELIWTTLEPLDKGKREEVRKYFNTYFGEGESLQQWFKGDLSGKDLQRATNYFN